LHGDDAEGVVAVAALGDAHVQLPLGSLGLHPGQVLLGGAGVDHDAEAGFAQEIDDQVVDHAAGVVQHGGVERLAGDGQLGDVVGDQARQESAAIGADQIDRAHVRDVEHPAVVAHGVVFLDLRTVIDWHVPAAKIDHPGIERAVRGVEYRFLQHIHPFAA